MTETIFTKIINEDIPSYKIYEDKDYLAFLDIFPFEKGHTLVIPKTPYKTIMDMPEEEYLELQKVVLKIAKHYKKVLGCDIAIAQKNGKIAEQDIPHVHIHIIPRFDSQKRFFNENNPLKYLNNELENYKTKLKL